MISMSKVKIIIPQLVGSCLNAIGLNPRTKVKIIGTFLLGVFFILCTQLN